MTFQESEIPYLTCTVQKIFEVSLFHLTQTRDIHPRFIKFCVNLDLKLMLKESDKNLQIKDYAFINPFCFVIKITTLIMS